MDIMNKSKVAVLALGQMAAVLLYIALVSFIMTKGEKIFGEIGGIFAPMGFLLLFTASAAITGTLVFGRSVVWYLEGKKQEAIHLALFTIGGLVVAAFLVFFVLALL